MWFWKPYQDEAEETARERVVEPADPALETPFMRELVRQVRATDTFGAWDHYEDATLIDPFILTAERKKRLPLVANIDAQTGNRVRSYYNAVAARIEARTGLMATPVVTLGYEGFGRALVLVGKLVAVDKPLREAHRFGFSSAEELVTRGEGLVDSGVEQVSRFPEAARA